MQTAIAQFCRLAGFILILGLLVRPAFGGPDPAIEWNPPYATFSGDQSNGIRSGVDFDCPTIRHLRIANLASPGYIGTPGEPLEHPGVLLEHESADGANRGWTVTGFSRADRGGTGAAGEHLYLDLDAVGWILTDGAPAVEVSSEAGDGGKGEDGYGTILTPGLGGHGGWGGDAGEIVVSQYMWMDTRGEGAHGIVARSQAGDGGKGGGGYNGIYVSGGDGGRGGSGGLVGVYCHGIIATRGPSSIGISAESLGGASGAGGDGGGLFGGAGAGSSSGKGGNITVNTGGGGAAYITTAGDDSHGIFAQSVGGYSGGSGGGGGLVFWGGSGGSSGDGGSVSVWNDTPVVTNGANACGVLAQSIGGGGGNAGATGGVVGLGGTGSAGGHGGGVEVHNRQSIDTRGGDSYGILALSVGGGGGSAKASGGLIGIGGDGKSTGDGGAVFVNNQGAGNHAATIQTFGHGAHSIVAQSIGGGGGSEGGSGALFSMGGDGDSTGDGQLVELVNTGSVATAGANSSCLFAQSLGGGGGVNGGSGGGAFDVGIGVALTMGGNSTLGGHGGEAFVSGAEPLASVATTGAYSHGLHAQSVGGGGG